jgi:hypothetical protein
MLRDVVANDATERRGRFQSIRDDDNSESIQVEEIDDADDDADADDADVLVLPDGTGNWDLAGMSKDRKDPKLLNSVSTVAQSC